MSFATVKDTIIKNARKYETCMAFQDLLTATTYEELAVAGRAFTEYAWKTKILTSLILDEVPDIVMTDNGIYYNKTGAIAVVPSKPYPYYDGYEIHIIGGDASFSFSGNGKYKTNILTGQATIITNDSVYLELNVYNSECNFTSKNTSIINGSFNNVGGQVITGVTQDDSLVDILTDANTQMNLDIQDNSFAKAHAFGKSIIDVTIAEDINYIAGRSFESSKINYLTV